MSIKTRLALLLGLLLLGFLAAWAATRYIAQGEAGQIVEEARSMRVRTLNHWIDLTGRSLPQFASEYAQAGDADELSPQISAARREEVRTELRQAGVDALWVLRGDGALQLYVDALGESSSIVPPLSAQEFAALFAATPNPHFYTEDNGELLELSIRKLRPASNRPEGWAMLVRRWNAGRLELLSQLTESKISLVSPAENARPADDSLVVLRPLTDWKGREIRLLKASYDISETTSGIHADSRSVQLFVVFGLLLIAAVALALHAWVLTPLNRISDSLAHKDASLLGPLSKDSSELGRVARLVEFSFEQTEALQKNAEELRFTMEERARLGWNLHDGVIQSLYAAGMGLTGVRTLLKSDQQLAVGRLEQVRNVLNETIHDVRNFITGLEPEALKQQTFTQAVSGLLATMQAIRPVRTTLEIDEVFAARLTLPQRVHVLQIIREAVSNALRHGEATHVSVTLRTHADATELEVVDDGVGFDPSAPTRGKGLNNLTERARELGSRLAIESAAGKGTRMKLVFQLPSTL